MKRHKIVGLGIGVFAVATLTFGALSRAAENIGTSRQPLVGGALVDAEHQEEFGLLGYQDDSGSCSASLLRNDWVVTAAHCVDMKNAKGEYVSDPNRPGQNKLKRIAGMKLTASWKNPQTQTAIRVETFRPYDIAIIKVDKPFVVGKSSTRYSRLTFRDAGFPYFGEPVGASLLIFGTGINRFASGSGASAVPSSNDGLYRMSYSKPTRNEDNRYWYPSVNGQMIAGGDSGGPSFAWCLNGYALVGVHSLAHTESIEGKPKEGWDWVSSTSEAADAPIADVWDQIIKIIGPMPYVSDPTDPPNTQTGNVGTFAKTPPDFQPIWLYGIRTNGDVMWYRRDSNSSAWQGPKKVNTGWNRYKDVIAAGGNCFYALTTDNKLMWFRHDGFNNGADDWGSPAPKITSEPAVRLGRKSKVFAKRDSILSAITGGTEVGRGWNFKRIFSGGEGIVYAIRDDGKLMWYRHNEYSTGGNSDTWQAPREVGSDWGNFRDVFSTGKGHVYVVKSDGTLWLYLQKGYETGEKSWYPAEQVGVGWIFQQIIPVGQDAAGGDTILAIQSDGKLLWYKRSRAPRANALARTKMRWEGPVPIGSGWQDFGKVVALLPDSAPIAPR